MRCCSPIDRRSSQFMTASKPYRSSKCTRFNCVKSSEIFSSTKPIAMLPGATCVGYINSSLKEPLIMYGRWGRKKTPPSPFFEGRVMLPLPGCGSHKRAMTRSSDDFPQPDGPTMTQLSPALRLRFRERSRQRPAGLTMLMSCS